MSQNVIYETFDQAIEHENALRELSMALESLPEYFTDVSIESLGVSTESVSDALKRAAQAIIAFMKRIYQASARFFKIHFSRLGIVKNRINKQKEELANLKGAKIGSGSKTIRTHESWNRLNTFKGNIQHFVKGYVDHETTLTVCEKKATDVLSTYNGKVLVVGLELAKALENAKGKFVDLKSVTEAIRLMIPSENKVFTNLEDSRRPLKFVDGDWQKVRGSFPGGKTVFINKPFASTDNNSGELVHEAESRDIVLDYWKKVQDIKYVLDFNEKDGIKVNDALELEIYGLKEISNILATTEALADIGIRYIRSTADHEKYIARLEKATNHILKVEEKDDEVGENVYQTALRFIAAYTRWSIDLQKDVLTVITNTCLETLWATETMLAHYHRPQQKAKQ